MTTPMLPQELPPMRPAPPSDPTWRVQCRLSVGLYRAHKGLTARLDAPVSAATVRRMVYDALADLTPETHVGTVVRALLGEDGGAR